MLLLKQCTKFSVRLPGLIDQYPFKALFSGRMFFENGLPII